MSETVSTPTTSVASDASNGASEGTPNEAGAAETAAAVASAKKKYLLKVDGQDIEEEFDSNDEESVKKMLQLGHGAKKRMAEAAADKKKAFEIVKAFESDPESMLRRLGPKGREIAEKYLVNILEDEMRSPEEREYRQLKKENETYKQREQGEKDEREKSVQAKKENDYAQSFQQTIIQALEKSKLPKTPELVKRMAGLMAKNLEYGLELTSDDLAEEAKKDLTSIIKSMIGDSDGDHLINLFGPDVANKIRKSDIKRLQEKQSEVFQGGKSPSKATKAPTPVKGYETMEEWKARIDRNLKNKA